MVDNGKFIGRFIFPRKPLWFTVKIGLKKGKTVSTWTNQVSILIALGRNHETKLLVGGLREMGRFRKCYYALPTIDPLPEKKELRN